jgi:hypothetical protein
LRLLAPYHKRNRQRTPRRLGGEPTEQLISASRRADLTERSEAV